MGSMAGLNSPKTGTSSRVWCRNALVVAAALVFFEIGFLVGRISPTEHAKQIFLPLTQTTTGSPVSVAQRPKIQLPDPFTSILPLVRDSPKSHFYLNHRFSQPLLLHAYMRVQDRSRNKAQLILLTTGVSMGTFHRNFAAAGCKIGNHVYPVDKFIDDRVICVVPRDVQPGVPITLVLHKDQTLEAAMEGPVQISKEFVAQLEDGDLGTLDDGDILHGELGDYQHDELVPIRSEFVYDGQMDAHEPSEYPNIPRYEVCLATQIKPSIHLLPDWIDYHRRLGFDHIYIFDNHAEKDLAKMYEHRHDVEVAYWPWEKSQIQSFTFSVFALRPRCEWLALMDTDEYVMIGLGGDDDLSKRDLPPIKAYLKLREAQGFGQVWFHWVRMKNSDFVTPPPEPVPDVYIHRMEPQLLPDQKATLGKTMIQMDYPWELSNAHSRYDTKKAKIFNDLNGSMFPSKLSDSAMIVHYQVRSWKEYQDKLRFGRANMNNPATLSKLMKRERRASDERQSEFMRMGKRNRKVYTHFRDIWRRVTKELAIDTSVTVRYVDGQRCRTFYNASGDNFAQPLEEKCTKEEA